MPTRPSTPPSLRARIRGADLDGMVSVYLANRQTLADPDSFDSPSQRAARWLTQATCGYAAGMPLSYVREEGRAALLAYRVVQDGRPSREELTSPTRVLRNVPHGNLPNVRRVVRVDGSTGAGYVAIRYLYWALLLRESELAAELAAAVWDPGPPFEPDFQLNIVARALCDLLEGDAAGTLDRLSRVRRTATKHEHQQAAAVSALARGDGADVARALHELAAWHRRAKVNEYLMAEKARCRSASGLAALALDRGLVSAGDLPVDVDTFATELVLEPPE
jgi:hypothetical protein